MKRDEDGDRQDEIRATPRGVDPLRKWELSTNDKRFLRSINIALVDPPDPGPEGRE